MKKSTILLSFMLSISSLPLIAITETTKETVTTVTTTTTNGDVYPSSPSIIVIQERKKTPQSTMQKIATIGCFGIGIGASVLLLHKAEQNPTLRPIVRTLLELNKLLESISRFKHAFNGCPHSSHCCHRY